MSRLQQATDAIEKWVEFTMYDQAVEYNTAFDVVMAKIQAKISESKRQQLTFKNGKFEVTTLYTNQDRDVVSAMSGQPHVEVMEDGIRFGCIMMTNDAIMEMIVLLSKRIKRGQFTAQGGYMPPQRKKKSWDSDVQTYAIVDSWRD